MIICKNLSKAFFGHRVRKEKNARQVQIVLNSFSYTFEDSGFYLLFGESGSGKTTFLNILGGFLDFDGGEVVWDGRSFKGRVMHPTEKPFDYITQEPFFVDFLSVKDNMHLISDDDDEILRVLDRFGLKETADQLPTVLSGGEKQRLAIVRTLLSGKKVIFLDEPTAALDEKNKTAVFQMLSQLSDSILIICSSHDAAAKEYAKEIIPFTKIKEKIDGYPTGPFKIRKKSEKEEKRTKAAKKNPDPFLKKWFYSEKRARKAGLLFFVFLFLASCLCFLADTPENKLDSSIEYMYGINAMEVITNKPWKDIVPEEKGIRAVVLSYNGSCPDGTERPSFDGAMVPEVGYDLFLNVIPFEKKVFKLSDRLLYGTYFTEENQVILSKEMALSMNRDNPEKLLGEYITKNIYGQGAVRLEIVGVFDTFDSAERMYLNTVGVAVTTDVWYNPEYNEDLCFVNSKLTECYEEDETFYQGRRNPQRTYYIYFDSYRAMKNYYTKHCAELTAHDGVRVSYDGVNGLKDLFVNFVCVLLPLCLFVTLFSTLFYTALKKIEFQYNNRFVAVFEQAGYSKKRVIRHFIFLNILELIKILLASEILAFALTFAINKINEQLVFINFQIFTYSIYPILAFNVLVILMAFLTVTLLFRKVKVSSYYEILMSSRDLI